MLIRSKKRLAASTALMLSLSSGDLMADAFSKIEFIYDNYYQPTKKGYDSGKQIVNIDSDLVAYNASHGKNVVASDTIANIRAQATTEIKLLESAASIVPIETPVPHPSNILTHGEGTLIENLVDARTTRAIVQSDSYSKMAELGMAKEKDKFSNYFKEKLMSDQQKSDDYYQAKSTSFVDNIKHTYEFSKTLTKSDFIQAYDKLLKSAGFGIFSASPESARAQPYAQSRVIGKPVEPYDYNITSTYDPPKLKFGSYSPTYKPPTMQQQNDAAAQAFFGTMIGAVAQGALSGALRGGGGGGGGACPPPPNVCWWRLNGH